ncbi:MAG: radical SAM protein [Bacteroidales bacterium]|nr:radical SAM protein [Bacteroidales bacterium]
MPVFLFDETIFGPVKSRRLGVSLGINLLPLDYKYCNFDCIYCECGRTHKEKFKGKRFHDRKDVKEKLENVLSEMKKNNNSPDVITFAGNGEPTIHPDFEGIIGDTIITRNKYFPKARIAVLSNATLIQKKSVFNALQKVDDNILKLDSAFDETVKFMNNPPAEFTVKKLVGNLKAFKGNLIIQTMFLSGTYKGKSADNTNNKEVEAWIKLLKEIKPKQVMIYTIDRDTPSENLKKVSPEKLYEIAEKVKNEGFEIQVSV